MTMQGGMLSIESVVYTNGNFLTEDTEITIVPTDRDAKRTEVDAKIDCSTTEITPHMISAHIVTGDKDLPEICIIRRVVAHTFRSIAQMTVTTSYSESVRMGYIQASDSVLLTLGVSPNEMVK